MSENFLIIAGEKSGEEHALSFFDDLSAKFPDAEFWGVGGDILKSKGMRLMYHLRDFSSWGVSEVIGKIPFYFNALKSIEREVEKTNTKNAILIDFQDFNLRLAKRLKKKGVNVFYYVAPQAWAWKAYRAKVLEQCIHSLFTIIPFEKKWFKDRGVSRVVSIDHPLLSHYQNDLSDGIKTRGDTLDIAILPGSRNFEVKELLPEFLGAIKLLRKSGIKIKTHLVRAQNVKEQHYAPYLNQIDYIYEDHELVHVLKKSDYAIAASGTVTLACALFGVPTVVSYKSSLLNEFIFYTFLSYTGPISLANIVHEKLLFPELIQNSATDYNIYQNLLKWISSDDSPLRKELFNTRNIVKGDDLNTAEYIFKAINE